VFSGIENEKRYLYSKSADGSGAAEKLPYGEARTLSPEGWSADGRLVVSYQEPNTSGFDIGIMSPGFDAIQPFLKTPTNEDSFTLSRDGHWIAYEGDSTGQYEVYVERFPEGGDRHAISAPEGGEDPVWSYDETELFYRRLKDKAMMTVPIKMPAFTAGTPKTLFQGDYWEAGGRNYDVDKDGRRFLLFKNVAQGEASAPRLILVQNWTEELKRLAPSGH
jgi:hypothetical protein